MKMSALRWPRRVTRGLGVHFLCGMLVPLACAAPSEIPLTTAQIRSTVGGRQVTDGLHWSHDYFLDGRLDRSENGRTRAGRWSAQNNQLCLLLPEISKESPICFDVVRVVGELQYRDAGSVVYAGTVKKRTTVAACPPREVPLVPVLMMRVRHMRVGMGHRFMHMRMAMASVGHHIVNV